MKKIIIAGIGPGSREDITPAVVEAVATADVVVGYKYYFQFITPYIKNGCECIDTGMKRERERAAQAFEMAVSGKTVVVISSGDAGIYGMTPLIYEMRRERGSDIEIASLPGISAFQKAASLLGAPIGHDMCIISMSDLMTPWEVIERRIVAAAVVVALSAVAAVFVRPYYVELGVVVVGAVAQLIVEVRAHLPFPVSFEEVCCVGIIVGVAAGEREHRYGEHQKQCYFLFHLGL